MSSFFITGTGTGTGKTLVTTTLCWQLRQQGKKVMALKPVVSGYDANDPNNDTALILQSLGLPTTDADHISPWRFSAPLSPNIASEKEGKSVDMEKLIEFCHRATSNQQPATILVEGAGGVMSPLNNQHTMLDWMEMLGWPVILVAGTYLGSISHTLSALEALKARKLTVAALIVSESEEGVALTDTLATLKTFLPAAVPVVQLPRIKGASKLWEQALPIHGFMR